MVAFLNLLYLIVNALTIIIIVDAIMSWFPRSRYHPLGRLVHAIADVVLAPARRVLKPIDTRRGTLIDLSPLVTLFALWVIYALLVELLTR